MMATRTEIIEWLDWTWPSRLMFVAIVPWFIMVSAMMAPPLLELLLAWKWTGLHDTERTAVLACLLITSAYGAWIAFLEKLK